MANAFPLPLDNGAAFPSMSLKLAGGGRLELPGDWAGSHGVLLIYRGRW